MATAARRSLRSLVRCQCERGDAAPFDQLPDVRGETPHCVARHVRGRMLHEHDDGIERHCARDTVGVSRRSPSSAPTGRSRREAGNPASNASCTARSRIVRRWRLDVEGERHRQILHHTQSVEQGGTIGHDANAVDELEPLLTVANVGGRHAEHADDAGVGNARTSINVIIISAVGASNPRMASCWPAASVNRCRRSGRRPW